MTAFQYLFIAALSAFPLIQIDDLGRWSFKRPSAPIFQYLKLTVISFVISVASNKVFDYGVTQPFSVVFRSLSLLVSFLVGTFIFKDKQVDSP